MENYKIDPWASETELNYEKLYKYFGIRRFSEILPHVTKTFGKPHHLMTRGVVFGHRDYDRILQAYNNKEKIAIVTGFMPSGKFHLGHKMVADQLIYYQKLGFSLFIVIADAEAYAIRRKSREEVIELGLYEYVANLIALGLEKNKNTHIYFQTNYDPVYYRLIQMFSRRVTLSEMEAIYGTIDTTAKIVVALTQAADILHPQLDHFGGYKNVLVPVGADQDPHLRLTRDIAERFRNDLGLERPASTYHRFIQGLDGKKMSSSRPDYTIFLSDPIEISVRKFKRALTGGRATIEEQKKLGGIPEKCMIYETYLYHLILDDTQLRKIYNDCRRGQLLCGPDKDTGAELLAKFLEEHHKKLEKARSKIIDYVEPPKF